MAMIALSTTDHLTATFKPREGYEFAKSLITLPILMAELSKAIPHYVLGFTKSNDQFTLSALVGVDADRHAYLFHDGRWLCGYVPAAVRAYPFGLAKNEDQYIFCIDGNHIYPQDTPDAVPLFTSEGSLSEKANESLDFLKQCEENRAITQKAVQALADADVLSEHDLIIPQEEGKEPIRVTGFYRVDEKKLLELDAESFASLRSTGSVALAYAQLFSLAQVSQITERLEFIAKHTPETASGIEDLDQMFGADDTLKFNF